MEAEEQVLIMDANDQDVTLRRITGRDKVKTWRDVGAGDVIWLTDEEIARQLAAGRTYARLQKVERRRILTTADGETATGYRLEVIDA